MAINLSDRIFGGGGGDGVEHELTATQVDALLPITHLLDGIPTICLKVDNGTDYEQQPDPASFFKSDDTQIKGTGTTLAGAFGGSTMCLLSYWSTSPVQPTKNRYWNTYVLTSSAPVLTGDEILADTTGSGFSLVFPSDPSGGDRIAYSLKGSNTLTFDGNGKTVAITSTSTDGDSGEFVYDGTSNWRLK